MDFLLIVILFGLGVIVGSFLNVVILRFNTGLSFWGGRSQCLTCTHTLEWYDLFPLGSFLINRMRCRYCSVKLSPQYPLVELLLGILFASVGFLYPFDLSYMPLVLIDLSILAYLVLIFVYDILHKIIPDAHVFSFIVLSLLHLLVGYFFFDTGSLVLDLLAGPALAFPFWFLWFISRGTWMGFGDVKLAWGIGWLLGMYAGLSAIVLAFWVGALVSLGVMAFNKIRATRYNNSVYTKLLTMKSEVPFAPFLIVGSLLVYFLNISVIDLSILFAS